MAEIIPQHLLDEILSRLDIVELISGYFPLKRAGRNFKALCPFHHEKTPSFMVNPQRQIFHCFGCGKGGNAFSFLMEYERMDFLESVKALAAKTGVALPQPGSSNKGYGIISSLYKINELACTFYQNILNSSMGAAAREYLSKRDISNEMRNVFRLGLSPSGWDGLLNYLRSKNVSLSLIERSGLICSRQEGGYYDRFRKRLIFPIFDAKSRVIAFGARILTKEAELAKYINSPESPIYIKGRHLYGLNITREEIRRDDYAIVVEGYFDCISVYQSGIKNVVASLGTSLTIDQIRLLKRYTHNIVMIYDSDQAGQEATLRSMDMFIQEGMNVRVAVLPPELDPDSFLRRFGSKAFRDRINNAKGLFDYKLNLLTSRFNRATPEGKARIAQEMLISLSNLNDAILRFEYIRRLAQVLDIKEEAIVAELNKVKDKKLYIHPEFIKRNYSRINPTEKLLIRLVLRETELISRISSVLSPEDFQDERTARVFSLLCDLISRGEAVEPHRLIGYLDDRESASLVSELLAKEDEVIEKDTESVLTDCVSRIKRQSVESRCQYLQRQIKIAQQQGDHEQLNRLAVEFRDLQRLRAT